MARLTGIFGRKSRQGHDSTSESVPVREFFDQESEELERALAPDEPPVDHHNVDYSITEDWEMPSAVRRPPSTPDRATDFPSDPEPPSDTGEWVAQPHPQREPRLLVQERPRPEPASSGDTGEQIRIAATGAAQQAEIRAMDEIVALERDIEEAREAAATEIEGLETSLRDAEVRAKAAEDEAAALASEREQFEDRAREAAKQWLRERIPELKAAARKKIRAEVERLRAEDGAAGDDRAAATTGNGSALPQPDLQELVEAETEELRRFHAKELAEAEARVDAVRREERDRAADELERRLHEAATDPEERQRELAAARAEAESSAAERISKVEAEADERVRSEVAIARRAAEEHFAEVLGAREEELERERVERIALIEESDRRLRQIDARASDAIGGVAVAEQHLAAESEQHRVETAARLSAEADERIEAAEERARQAEAEAEARAHKARLAATNWLRGEAQALRREGERSARSRNGGRAAEPKRTGAEQRTPTAEAEPQITASATRGAAAASNGGAVSLAGADLGQLMSIGMSQTQARRVLRYRDERGLTSVSALADVPGFPRVFLDRLGGRLVD